MSSNGRVFVLSFCLMMSLVVDASGLVMSLESSGFVVVDVRVVDCGETTASEVSSHTPKTHRAMKITVMIVEAYEFEEEDRLLFRVLPKAIIDRGG